jgi:phosphomannomutase
MEHTIHPVIFREYDIRGTYDQTLFSEDAYSIGKAFGTFLKNEISKENPKVCVGFDGRLSSPSLEPRLIEGLKDSGVYVLRVGQGPSPMLYYSVIDQQADAGVMVTGSHNPKQDNGFKFMVNKMAFYGSAVQKLLDIIISRTFKSGIGQISSLDYADKYTQNLLDKCPLEGKLKVVWDPGHGATTDIVTELSKHLKGEHIVIHGHMDGNFPAHHPDPTVAENLISLQKKVAEEKADIGVAFDGDGDRIGVVDHEGNILWGDQILMLLGEDVLKKSPGATIITDIKASQVLFKRMKELGGNPLLWKTGHSLIKAKMKETGALLAGEMSGHIFMADEYYGFDDAVYSALRLIRFIESSDMSLSQMRKNMPTVFNTPEIRLNCSDNQKFHVVEHLKKYLQKNNHFYIDIDGVRFENALGWWLVRASNTQAKLVIRLESTTEEGLNTLIAHLVDILENLSLHDLKLQLLEKVRPNA